MPEQVYQFALDYEEGMLIKAIPYVWGDYGRCEGWILHCTKSNLFKLANLCFRMSSDKSKEGDDKKAKQYYDLHEYFIRKGRCISNKDREYMVEDI